jgi:hypothetical protein
MAAGPLLIEWNSSLVPINEKKIQSILDLPPLIEIDSEGRAKIISTNQFIRSTYIIAASLESGHILYFHNGVSCSKKSPFGAGIIARRLDDGKPFLSNKGSL